MEEASLRRIGRACGLTYNSLKKRIGCALVACVVLATLVLGISSLLHNGAVSLISQLGGVVRPQPNSLPPRIQAPASLVCSNSTSPLPNYSASPSAVAWSPDGRLLIGECIEAASGQGEVTVFRYLLDARTLHVVARSQVASGAICAAWSHDGRMVAVSGDAKSIAIYAVPPDDPGAIWLGKPVAQVSWPSPSVTLAACTFSPDSEWLAALAFDSSADGTPVIPYGTQVAVAWRVGMWADRYTLPGNVLGDNESSLAWSSDGRYLLAAEAGDVSARVWTRGEGTPDVWQTAEFGSPIPETELVGGGSSYVTWADAARAGSTTDQPRIVTASVYTVACYDTITAAVKPIWSTTMPVSSGLSISGVTPLSKGRTAVVMFDHVYIFDVASGGIVGGWLVPGGESTNPITSAAGAPDGRTLVVSSGSRIFLYDVTS